MHLRHPHVRRHVLAGALASLSAVALVAAPVAAQTERFALVGDRVAVYNLAGRVQVDGGGSDVRVEVVRGGSDASQLRVATGRVGGREALRVVYPSDRIVYPELRHGSRTTLSVNEDGTFGDGGDRGLGILRGRDRVEIRDSGSGLEAHADMRITVPRGTRLDLHLATGDVRIANVDGDLFVDVSIAEVTSEHTRGTLSLDTGSGAVRVSDAQGDVNLDTGSGGVTINGVRGQSLRMDTGSGSISGGDINVRELIADVGSGGIRLGRVSASRVNLDTGSGGTDLELLSDVDDVVIDAGSGGVTLRVPANIGAQLELETGSGGIETDLPVQVKKWERRYLSGTIGDGRGRIRIESGSGSVKILRS